MAGRAYAALAHRTNILVRVRQRCQCRDKIRRCAAAAAQNRNAQFRKFCHLSAELCGIHVIAAGCRIRQACIWLDNERLVRPLAHLLDERKNFLRSQRTVDAHGGNIQAFQRCRHAGNRCTGKRSAGRLKAHGDPNRQIALLARRENSGFDFVQIGHRLKDYEIRARLLAGTHHLRVNLIRFIKCERAERLHQLTNRADIQRNFCSAVRRFFRNGDICRHQFFRCVSRALQFMRIGTKRIGINNIAASVYIAALNAFQNFRMLYTENFRAFAQAQSGSLQHGAHAAVK